MSIDIKSILEVLKKAEAEMLANPGLEAEILAKSELELKAKKVDLGGNQYEPKEDKLLDAEETSLEHQRHDDQIPGIFQRKNVNPKDNQMLKDEMNSEHQNSAKYASKKLSTKEEKALYMEHLRSRKGIDKAEGTMAPLGGNMGMLAPDGGGEYKPSLMMSDVKMAKSQFMAKMRKSHEEKPKVQIPPKGSRIALKGPIKPESINKLKEAGYHPYFKQEEPIESFKEYKALFVEELKKARQDEGLSPQRKASSRAKRNSRLISTPKGESKRYFAFQLKGGAMPGKKGEKVSGVPHQSKRSFLGFPRKEWGVHTAGTDKESGRSAAGVSAEYSKKHKNPVHAEHSRQRAKKLHSRKLEELRSMPKPNLPKAEMEKSGEKFEHLTHELSGKGARDPKALAAWIGRKKLGSKAFQEKAAAGHRKSEMDKAESKHDRCVEDVKRNSPEVKNPHAVCVAEGVRPSKWKKSQINPDKDADAELGEKVEHDVENHMLANKAAEKKEGHKIFEKAKMDEGKSKSAKQDSRFKRNKPLRGGSLKERLMAGVHQANLPKVNPGQSSMGDHSNEETKKRLVREKTAESKAMPKPNLPKAEMDGSLNSKRKPTIYEALKNRLNREPSHAEIKSDVQRIIHEGTIKGKSPKGKKPFKKDDNVSRPDNGFGAIIHKDEVGMNAPKETPKMETGAQPSKADPKSNSPQKERDPDAGKSGIYLDGSKKIEPKDAMLEDKIEKEELGFKKLKNKLSHEKNPPRDPGAVAAAIGRKKEGKAAFQAKAAAGHKKAEIEKDEHQPHPGPSKPKWLEPKAGYEDKRPAYDWKKDQEKKYPSDPNDSLEEIFGLKNPRNSEAYKKAKAGKK